MDAINFPKKFVCATRDFSTYEHHVNAPLLRHAFELPEKPETAEIVISGLGFYELYLNGENITKGPLAPYISNSDDVVYFDRYDLTDKLKSGENVIGIILGNGFQNLMTNVWNFNKAVHTSSPKTALCFKAVCGGETVEFDAEALKCTESAITFDNLHTGVFYDARLEKDGWNLPGYDDSDWKNVIIADRPRGKAKLCNADPITVRKELAPVSVNKGEAAPFTTRKDVVEFCRGLDIPETDVPREGGYIYDFGVNTAGVFRFKIKGAKQGQKISFQCAEMLCSDGKIRYNSYEFYPDGYNLRDIYICRGDKEEEVFVPMFTYHGCRYVYVHGITEEQATKDAMTFLVESSDIKERADFSCSDETVNKLWEMAKRSDLSNFFYFPTDCPHREKNGWTGDAAASAEHMVMTLSIEKSIHEWFTNIRAVMREDGSLPGIVPTAAEFGFNWGNGPAWDRVLFELPFVLYIYRGDTDIIKENRHAMMSYLEYIAARRNEDGLVNVGLGDWTPVGKVWNDGFLSPIALTDSIMVYDMCSKAEKMFRAVGNGLDALYASALGKEIKEAIRKNLIDFGTMTAAGYCQTSQAMAIYYGIFETGELYAAQKRLLEIIHADGDSMNVGYLGARVLFHVLSDMGESELAFRMITKKDFPSYGYLVEMGLTSLPEKFRDKAENCLSLNHHFYGDINNWFLRSILGINVNPTGDDPNRILIKPEFISSLDCACGEYEAPAGKLRVSWNRDGETIRLSVTSDEKIKVRIELPHAYTFDKANRFRSYADGSHDFTVLPRKTNFE